jgi:membrane peptidoglycan carboxypeptidase
LDKGGYTIWTTFDKKAMDDMKAAVDGTFKGKLDPKRTVVNTVDDRGTPQYGKSYPVDAWLHAGGASVKPGDGAVTAIYGGPDYLKQQFDDADNPGVLVGSTFKAFVLAAALEYGVQSNNQGTASPGTGLSLDTLYNGNNKLKIRKPDGTLWTDKNGPWTQVNDSGENLGPINLKKAMAQSVNTVYVQLGMDVGMDKVKQAAIQAGLSPSTQWGGLGPSFALGTSTPGPIRLAAAYATFASSGMEADPYEVDHYTVNGKTVSLKSTPKRVFSPDVADSVTTALKAVINGGTGEKARALGWDAAGKTGTTDSKRSAWFVGYTKTLSTAIGLWDQSPKDHSFWPLVGLTGKTKIYGADYPTEIWTTYMKSVLSGETPVDLPADPHYGVVQNEAGVRASASASPSASASASATQSVNPSPTPSLTQGNGNGNGGNGNGNGGTGTSPSPTASTCILFCGNGGGNGGHGNGGGTGGGSSGSPSSSPSTSNSPATGN